MGPIEGIDFDTFVVVRIVIVSRNLSLELGYRHIVQLVVVVAHTCFGCILGSDCSPSFYISISN